MHRGHLCVLPQYRRIIHYDQMSLSPGMQGWFNTKISIHVKHYLNRMKDTKYTIISRNAENKSDKIQYPFMI